MSEPNWVPLGASAAATVGPSGPASIPLHMGTAAASAAATNNGATTFTAVSDPNERSVIDLRGKTKIKIMGRIGGALVAATKMRVQYHPGGNPAVATGDAGWATLAESAGSHTLNTIFYSAEIAIPAPAQINDCVIRVGIYGGDGAADPTITMCILNIYS